MPSRTDYLGDCIGVPAYNPCRYVSGKEGKTPVLTALILGSPLSLDSETDCNPAPNIVHSHMLDNVAIGTEVG
jgi:hypothetical protein